VYLDRPRLHLAEALGSLGDAYQVVDEAPESPRRRTLVDLIGGAIMRVEHAGDAWVASKLNPAFIRSILGGAVQSCVLVDLLSEVVVRDAGSTSSPTAAELDLHDRVRGILASARPALVIAEDTAADARIWVPVVPPVAGAFDDAILELVADERDEPHQPTTDTMLDLMLAADRIRERLQQRSDAPLAADPAAREDAMLAVTLARHCLDRTVAGIEALTEGEPDVAFRDLHAANSALEVCEDRLPEDVNAMWPLIAESLDNLNQ
jgi:hypothetical protein